MDKPKRRTFKLLLGSIMLAEGAKSYGAGDPSKPSPKPPATTRDVSFTIGTTSYPTLATALAAMRNGDTLDIAPGRYPGECGHCNASNVTIQCLNGEAIFSTAAEDKATFVLGGDNITLTGLAGVGITNSGGNGGLVRMEGSGHVGHLAPLLTLNNIRVEFCQTGVLTNPSPASSQNSPAGNGIIRLNNCHGSGNGDASGQSHAFYIHHCAELYVDRYDMRDSITGHLLKTHADKTFITNSIFIKGRASFAIDVCRRSYLDLRSSYIQQKQETSNAAIIQYAAEQNGTPDSPQRYPQPPLSEVHIANTVQIFDYRSPQGVPLNLKLQPDVLDVHYQLNKFPDPHLTDPLYEGFLDAADVNQVSGWAWDSTRPNTLINVNVFLDGSSTPAATLLANDARTDLVGKGNGMHGFHWPAPRLAIGNHIVSVKFPSGLELQQSPRTIAVVPPPRAGTTNPAWPAWRQNMPLNVLTPIPNSAPSKHLPSDCKRPFEIYSGLYQDTVNSRVYSAGSDGHAGGDTNWVYGVALKADAPAWRVLRSTSTDVLPVNSPYHADGRPVGSHLYYYGQVAYLGNEAVLVRTVGAATSYGGNAPATTDCFRISKNDWDLRGEGWEPPSIGGYEGTCAKDPRDQKIYVMGPGFSQLNQNNAAVLDPATGKWRLLPGNGGGSDRVGSCVVPELDTWFYAQNGRNDQSFLFAYRIRAARHDRVTIAWDCPLPDKGARAMWLCERQHRIYMMVDGNGPDDARSPGTMYMLDYRTMRASLVLQNVPAPWPYTYNKIEDFPALGGFVYWPNFKSDGLFFATE